MTGNNNQRRWEPGGIQRPDQRAGIFLDLNQTTEILPAQQDDIHPSLIRSEYALRVEQGLEDLIKRRKLNIGFVAQFMKPEFEGPLDGFRCKRRANANTHILI